MATVHALDKGLINRANSNSFYSRGDHTAYTERDRKYRLVCENCGWEISDVGDTTIELGKYSPAGEDFSFTAEKENFIKSVKEYAAYFDIDEHIEMWIEARKSGMRGVPSTRELVKDAEDIDKMLQELAAALASYEN
jgi:hypothetical protein